MARGKIESGELQPGRKIPSEKDIMDVTGVARTTARRAVAVLRDEGLVVTTPGRGTHVVKRLSQDKAAKARAPPWPSEMEQERPAATRPASGSGRNGSSWPRSTSTPTCTSEP